MRALVTGGAFDGAGEGLIWHLDLARERAELALRWTPPPALHVPGKGFAGGSLAQDGLLYIAAHAAVVRVDPRAMQVTGVLHQPCMNDLHHVAALGERLYVANTGLCAVDTFDRSGAFLGSHALLPAWANARRLGGADLPPEAPVHPGWAGAPPAPWSSPPADAPSSADPYYSADRADRPFHQLKIPDHLHVNHVTALGDRLLATCFADGTLRDLATFQIAAALPGHALHDGVLDGDGLWLTATDGRLIELDSDLRPRRRLNAFDTGHFGWCRGLAITRDHLLVGLTEVRRGRLVPRRWAPRDPEGSETSVLLLDRADGRLLARIDLTDRAHHSKLYSILPLP